VVGSRRSLRKSNFESRCRARICSIRVSSRARRAAAHPRPAPQRPLHRIVVVGQRSLVEQLVPAHRSHRTKLACTSSPTVTVVDSLMVGDLGMWLYRAHPGNPR